MSSIDNSGGLGGGFNLSVSGAKGAVQINGGSEQLGSYPTIKTTAGTLSASLFIGDGGLLSNTAGVSNLQQVTTQGATTTDAITTGGLTTTGTISATSLLVDTLTESLTVVGDVNVGGNGTVTGTLTTGTLFQTPVLEVSEDATITGNLTVSGGVVSITTTNTGTNRLIITNAGTGPAIVANQTGNQPLVDFQDDSTSVFFISGGEGARPAGYVGIGTTEPAKKLEVIGDIKGTNLTATGTLSSAGITSSDNVTISGANKILTVSNISTSNLTVTNFHSTTGTISTSNINTSNLTVSNRLSGGTISVSNIEATANLVVGGPADVTGTLSAAGITSSAAVNVTGTISSSSTVTGTDVVVSGTAQGLNLTSTGTLSAAGITSSAAVNVTGTISSSSTVTGTDVVVSGTAQGLNLTSTGTLSAAGITLSADTNITGALNLTLSDNGSAAGPEFTMHRYSADPAAADYIGQIKFTGEHSGVGADQVYAKITGKISDATQGSEDGLIEIAVVDAGSNKITTRFTNNALKLINTTGLEVDGTISATDNVTISGADKILTVSNISTSNLTVSNRLSGGTISVSNIEATSNLVVGGPADITGTLSVGNTITSSSNVKITGGYVQIKYA